MENGHQWLQLRNMWRMEERVGVRLRRRVIRDRSNPFEDFTKEEFLLRFRLIMECVLNLLENIREQLPCCRYKRYQLWSKCLWFPIGWDHSLTKFNINAYI